MPTDPNKQDPNAPANSAPPKPSTLPGLPPEGLNFKTPLWGGDLSGNLTQPAPGQYQGIGSYLFKNGDSLGASALLGTRPLSIEQYGLNGQFGLGQGGTAKFGFDAMPPKDTYKWLADLKFGDGSTLNADLTKTPQGDILKTAGLWKIDQNQQLSGHAEFNGVEKFRDYGLKWNDSDRHALNLGLREQKDGSIFKGDGKATLRPGDTLTGSFDLNNIEKYKDFKLGGVFGDKHNFNLNYNDSLAGSIFKGDGKATLRPGDTLTGSFDVNNVEKYKDFKLGGVFGDKHNFNLNYNDSLAGSIFKGDGKLTPRPGDTLTSSFEFNNIEKFKDLKLGGNFNDQHSFNFNFKDTLAGSILKGDGKATLRPGDILTGSFELNGVEKFKDFKLGGNFNDKHSFDVNYKESPGGSLFKSNVKTTFGDGSVLTGSAQVDHAQKFKEYALGYSTLGGSKLDLGLKNLEAGNIFNADGKLMLNKKDFLTGSVLLNGVEKTNEFKLGANIKDNLYNFNLGTSPLGTQIGASAQIGFDGGKGQVGVEGKFGPKLSEAMGSVSYTSKDLTYSGSIKFDNEGGRFGLSELGAKLSKGNDRFNYGIEASVNPRSGDFKVMAGISISFGGGGSRRSESSSNHSPMFDRQYDPVADFKQKQAVAFDKLAADRQTIDRLGPHDRSLFDQAKAGVEKLNAAGAKLDVDKTAMYLASVANEKGYGKIEKIEYGKVTADGRQNLFIYDREPTHPLVKSQPVDPAVASNTPLTVSAEKLHKTPDPADAGKPVAVADAAPSKRGM